MIGVLGIGVIFVMVFGGYIAAGGKMAIILKSLPYEFTMIGGAAAGAFIISNDMPTVRHTLKDLKKVFTGPRWTTDDYKDLLCLLYQLIKLAQKNPVGLEEHIEAPGDSAVFSHYPKILEDGEGIALICDTLRSASMNYDDPHQVQEVLEKRIESGQATAQHSSHALQTMADGLPALGIVAAVLGVIKTMGSIDQPPEILGKLIGGALVGTFLGVFLAYGMVGPFASRVGNATAEDADFYQVIRDVLVASLHGHAANICIEVGRQNTPQAKRPSFSDLEDAIRTTNDRKNG